MAEKTTNRLKPKKEEIDLDIDDQFVEIAEQSEEEIIEEEEEAPVAKTEKKKVVRDKKPKAETEKKTKDKKEKTPSAFSQAIQFIRSERFKKLSGLFSLLFTVFLTVSFVSYLFTGAGDRSTIYPFSWAIFFDATIKAGNHMGKLGAYISHLFIWNGYGLTAFLTIPFIFSYGVNRLLQNKIIPTVRIFKHCFALTIILAPVLAFIFQNKTFPYGGAFGIYINDILLGYLGQIGTGTLLSFSILGYLVTVFNFNFRREEKQTVVIENENTLQHSIVTVDKSKAFTIVPTQATPSFSESSNKKKEEQPNEISLSNTFTADPIVSSQELELNQEVETEEPFNPDYDEDLELDIVETPVEEVAEEIENTPLGLYDPTLDLSNYKYPELDLLEVYGSEKIKIDTEELERNKNQIIGTLQNYGIEIQKIKATVGPTVTLYEIIPAPGVRISKIKNLEDDIALSLAALGIRIIAPIPGKGTIGIEVPNINKEVVSMRTLLASEKFQNTTYDLPIALGKTISNEIFIADLSKMPHLLMAGATGQGKSVGINALLVSLLYKKHPSQLKFVLVDPKKVELSLYSIIEKHFLAKLPGEEEPIIVDTKKVINTLKALCIEMDQRYNLLKEAGCRNLKEYNEKFISRRLNPNKGHRFLPYIVLVIDEFADLIMTAGKEIETPIARLAQLARAIGIHLIIATQRPSVNIITGTIKANFPARIAFKVSSKIDSRTILDTGGADQLIGRGDMLISINGEVIRLQCAFIDTPEVEKVTEFIGQQHGYPDAHLLPEVADEEGEGGDDAFDPDEKDEMFEEAARLIVQHQQGSTSLIQRRMKLGYNRAGRLMDQLEQAGVVGPNQGSKAREVLIKDSYALEQFLNNLGEKV
ncbi:DNA translocase FtsK [Bacteroidota bacterium]|nr:DNA translocase FtsK [Bacteroidota bacterium]